MGIGAGGAVEDSGELAVLRNLARTIEKGDKLCVFDVGSNQGQFLRMLLDHASDDLSCVHCFEPANYSFGRLQMVAAAYEFPHLHLNRIALGQNPGRSELYYDREGSGLASLTQRDLSFKNRSFDAHETVQLERLDSYCVTNSIDFIDWLKMDVEGHELDVLKGGMNTIKNGCVGCITLEFGGANIDTRTYFRDFYHFFEEASMRLYRVTPGGYLHRISRYRETEEQFTTMNFVAYRED